MHMMAKQITLHLGNLNSQNERCENNIVMSQKTDHRRTDLIGTAGQCASDSLVCKHLTNQRLDKDCPPHGTLGSVKVSVPVRIPDVLFAACSIDNRILNGKMA